MLTRLYVDNYRCLVDFEFKPQPVQLLLGVNGAGKSSLFHALEALRRIAVDGEPIEGLVGGTTQTSWAAPWDQQHFELELTTPYLTCLYKVVVSNAGPFGKPIIKEEQLVAEGKVHFHAIDGKLVIEDGAPAPAGSEVRTDRSTLAGIITFETLQFSSQLNLLAAIQINPWAMSSRSEKAARRPARDLANLGDWFRHLLQESPRNTSAIIANLAQVMPGLDDLVATEAGLDVRVIQGRFKGPEGKPVDVPLADLSEGQRALIGLYLLVWNLAPGATLLIDEPENFIALAEIQPWLLEAKDRVEEVGGQLIIASHHPEIMNQLAETAVIFERDAGSGTRIRPFPSEESALSPSEIVARGWESV